MLLFQNLQTLLCKKSDGTNVKFGAKFILVHIVRLLASEHPDDSLRKADSTCQESNG